jgi:23S rRNA pseudouridine1911/1915/1917 synthase
MESFIVENPIRLDKLLHDRFPEYSRSYFQYLIDHKGVKRNGKSVKKREIPQVGDTITVSFLQTPEITLQPQAIPLEILYEDPYLLCINKPAGMVVHPAPGHFEGTLVNALLYHCHSLPPQDLRPGIVHRLDRETSGVILAAKTVEAHQKLIEAFSARKMHKEYLAITIGNPGNQSFDAPIGRDRVKRKEMTVVEEGRPALSHIETLISAGDFSLVKVRPVTGRTHQIRVHLKHLKTPVLGDRVYGSEKLSSKLGVKRHLLHAHHITFIHPFLGRELTLTAPPPEDFQKWIEKLSS